MTSRIIPNAAGTGLLTGSTCFLPNINNRAQLTPGLNEGLKEIKITELIEVVLTVLDARDPYTFSHSLRVTQIATLIARDMKLPREQVKIIHEAAYLHDIGKVGIPDRC